MKTKNALLILSVFFAGNLFAQQQLPNSGFETWEKKTVNGYSFTDPQTWYTLNELQQFGFDETTSMSSEAHSGNYSAHLSSVSSSFGNIPGLLTTGPIMDDQGNPNLEFNFVPFTGRPGSISFWFKSFPEANDANGMFMMLTKWNTVTKSRDTIAYADWSMDSTVSSFTKANVPIQYYSSATPDSITFLISSSDDGFDPVAGSELFVDDLVFEYSNGIAETGSDKRINLWPNPVTDKCFIQHDGSISKAEIIDLNGRVLQLIDLRSDLQTIDITGLMPGMYICNFYSEDYQFAGNTRFIKE